MPNERFTDLPSTGSAQLTDIICAVQGYVSPSNPGLSVQEPLSQIQALFQSNTILFNSGNPNGALAGSTFQLCWDTVDTMLWVCTTSGSSSTAVWTKAIHLTAGSGVTISQSGATITVSVSGSGFTWNNVTGTSAIMVPNNGYQANNVGLVTLTLPVASSFGDIIHIAGFGSGMFTIAQNAGQSIIIGNTTSTTGVGGSVSSTNQYDSLILYAAVANTTWQALSAPQGNLTIV